MKKISLSFIASIALSFASLFGNLDMKAHCVRLGDIRLAGISIRTNMKNEMDPKKSLITKTIFDYFENKIASSTANRRNPGVIYCVYTNYESNEFGDYTYFIGEEVDSFNGLNKNLETLLIFASNYSRFSAGPGKMPETCINAWTNIWKMSPAELGGKRTYIADFEVYLPNSTYKSSTFDVYIGVQD